jgi:hypothetical protein
MLAQTFIEILLPAVAAKDYLANLQPREIATLNHWLRLFTQRDDIDLNQLSILDWSAQINPFFGGVRIRHPKDRHEHSWMPFLSPCLSFEETDEDRYWAAREAEIEAPE